jgi:hypothetical protein
VSILLPFLVQELRQIVLELHLTLQVLHTVEIYCKYVVVGGYGVVPELHGIACTSFMPILYFMCESPLHPSLFAFGEFVTVESIPRTTIVTISTC